MTESHYTRTCPECNRQYHEIGSNFCQFCGLALTGAPYPISRRPESFPVRDERSLSIIPNRTNVIDTVNVRRFAQSVYQSKEVLYAGTARWTLGKHFAAFEAQRAAEEVTEGLIEITKENILRTAEGILAGETALLHAQLNDNIIRDQMIRGAEMLADYIHVLGGHLRAAGLDEDTIIDLVESSSRLAQERSMQLPSAPPSPHDRIHGGNRPTIIDPDEF